MLIILIDDCGFGASSAFGGEALIAVAVGLPAAVLAWVGPLGGLDVARGAGFVLKSVLLIYVLVLMLTRVFRTRTVTLETVGLAICSYLMTAVVFEPRPIPSMIPAAIAAKRGLKAPEANGRLRLRGCWRSFSMSTRSLMM